MASATEDARADRPGRVCRCCHYLVPSIKRSGGNMRSTLIEAKDFSSHCKSGSSQEGFCRMPITASFENFVKPQDPTGIPETII